MARVEDWAEDFYVLLVERVPRFDWPAGGSEFWQSFTKAMIRNGVTKSVAEDASWLLAETSFQHITDAIKAFLDQCRAVWKTSTARDDESNTRDAAERLSVACVDCGGKSGFTVRWAKEDGSSTVLFCTCPLGRWIEKTLRTRCPDIRKRLHDLADYPAMHLRQVAWTDTPDNQAFWPPECWNAYANGPIYRPWEVVKIEAAVTHVREVPRRTLAERVAAMRLPSAPDVTQLPPPNHP